jgi:hypothetical protein
LGKGLLKLYCKVSPPTAKFVAEHPSLKPIVRIGLLSTVAISSLAVNAIVAKKTVLVGLLALISVALPVWAKGRRADVRSIPEDDIRYPLPPFQEGRKNYGEFCKLIMLLTVILEGREAGGLSGHGYSRDDRPHQRQVIIFQLFHPW